MKKVLIYGSIIVFLIILMIIQNQNYRKAVVQCVESGQDVRTCENDLR